MQQISASVIWDDLKPRIDALIATRISASGVRSAGATGGAVSAHALSGALHTGLLDDGQAPQFLLRSGGRSLTGDLAVDSGIMVDGVDISAHAANANAHHNQAHVLATDVALGGDHTVNGATAGHVLRASGATTAEFAELQHADLGGVTSDQHHAKLHAMLDTDHHSYSGGAAYDVFGLSAASTLAKLTPSYDVSGGGTALLRSNAGALALDTLAADTSITTPLITATTNLQLAPSVDLQLYPTGDVLLGDGKTFRTDSFSTLYPIEGMIFAETAVAGQYGLSIGVIEADELRVRVFVADEVRIDRGEEVWSKSYGITAADFTTPGSIGGTVVVTFESSPMITGALFTANDWLLFRTIDIDTGVVLSAVWGQVTGYTATNIVQFWDMMLPDSAMPTNSFPKIDLGTTTQDWTFTLRSGDTSYRIPEGSLGIDYGQTGQSYIAFSVTDPIAAPYIRIRRWTGSDPFTPANHDDTVYIGNLNGIANASGDRGIWTQNEAETSWAELSDDGVILRNASIALYDGATQKVNIGATGTDFWMGTSSADKRLSWDGTTLAIRGEMYIGAAAQPSVGYAAGDPSVTGLYLTPTKLGYYETFGIPAWKCWIASDGHFYFGGDSGAHLEWDGEKLKGTNGTTDQWYADSTDGKLYAGGGSIWLDSAGEYISATLDTDKFQIPGITYVYTAIADSLVTGSDVAWTRSGTTRARMLGGYGSWDSGNDWFGGVRFDLYGVIDTVSYSSNFIMSWDGFGMTTALGNILAFNEAGSTIESQLDVTGAVSITGNLTMADTYYVATDKVIARDSGGLALTDDAGILGVFIEDGGYVGIGTNNPAVALHVVGTVLIAGDQGGVAGTIGLSDVSVGVSSGTGTIKMNGSTARDSDQWIKIYLGTTPHYIPCWSNIS